jgi:hypothetical protein
LNADYTLKLGSPAIDAGDNSAAVGSTDLAGNARINPITSTVDIGAYEYEPDVTAPVVTPGVGIRTTDATGTASFSTNEAGDYYYLVVEEGDPAPSVAAITSGTGTACGTGTTTISLTGLTPTGKDVYIVVIDPSGNISAPVMVNVPAGITKLSADPESIDFGRLYVGYEVSPTQLVTITNIGNITPVQTFCKKSG